MKDCGFHALIETMHIQSSAKVIYTIEIFFPGRIERNSEPCATGESAMVYVDGALGRLSDGVTSMRVLDGENAF